MKDLNVQDGQRVHAIGGSTGDIQQSDTRGVRVGEVDHMDGSHYIKLKKSDQNGNTHHWFPVSWISQVQGEVVYVNKTPEQFRAELLADNPNLQTTVSPI